jgi:hypothetical protein
MLSHSTSAGKSSDVAFVSGPRTVSVAVLALCLVTTISQWLAAIEMNEPARTLRACQIWSTSGESDGRESIEKTVLPPPACRARRFHRHS